MIKHALLPIGELSEKAAEAKNKDIKGHTRAICVVHLDQKMELNREHFCAIIFCNFRRGLTQQQCIDELNSIFNQGPVFIVGMVNSTEVVVHFTLKVIQNQLLFRKSLMPCAN